MEGSAADDPTVILEDYEISDVLADLGQCAR
jgi:hypothetical protein